MATNPTFHYVDLNWNSEIDLNKFKLLKWNQDRMN